MLALLAQAGLDGEATLHPLAGGANNRVFRVESGGCAALLKAYFQHPEDPRDRLGAEFSFLRFAWESGAWCVPRPLASDRRHHLGLYEFVEGRPLGPDEVTGDAVREALDFYHVLNRGKDRPEARALPAASEACFSLAEHLECVERRLRRLRGIPQSSPVEREVVALVEGELGAAWGAVAEGVRQGVRELGAPLDGPLGAGERCLSPSDFGFHNAMLAPDGRLRFIDFEYAGWDDPAKLVCDFFCQPAVPVPLRHWAAFVEAVVGTLPRADRPRRRCQLLLPVYEIKWCCILLNDFAPVSGERRRFAGVGRNSEERKVEQLRKARLALQRVGAAPGARDAP